MDFSRTFVLNFNLSAQAWPAKRVLAMLCDRGRRNDADVECTSERTGRDRVRAVNNLVRLTGR